MAIERIQGTQASPIKKAAKVAAGAALTAGIVAAGLAAGNKADIFTKIGGAVGDKAGKFKPALDKALGTLNGAGEFVAKKADAAIGQVKTLGIKEKTTNFINRVKKGISSLADSVESRISVGKFNPDAAAAADKAAETFNNFVK